MNQGAFLNQKRDERRQGPPELAVPFDAKAPLRLDASGIELPPLEKASVSKEAMDLFERCEMRVRDFKRGVWLIMSTPTKTERSFSIDKSSDIGGMQFHRSKYSLTKGE